MSRNFLGGWAALATSMWLAACSTPMNFAPVENRTLGTPSGSGSVLVAPKRAPIGAANAGKPGYYTVQAGDTLMRVAVMHGQNFRELATWNGLVNPNELEVGDVLRVVPPVTAAVAVPINPPAAVPASGSAAQASPAPSGSARLQWPTNGPVLTRFDGVTSKGVMIGGTLGEPVRAAGKGRVVYAGAGLRGYGNLVIIKHTEELLTAYAHNQRILVKEDEAVEQGQPVAELGSSDSPRPQLAFEVRQGGKPVDPMRYLPAR